MSLQQLAEGVAVSALLPALLVLRAGRETRQETSGESRQGTRRNKDKAEEKKHWEEILMHTAYCSVVQEHLPAPLLLQTCWQGRRFSFTRKSELRWTFPWQLRHLKFSAARVRQIDW